jgi:hypothetical protein
MAAVTADQLISRQERRRGGGPVAASTILYAGTMAFWNADGYLDDDTGSGANRFAGIVVTQVDNSGGGNGDKNADLFVDGSFQLLGSGFAQTSVGLKAHATFNFTITLTPSASTCYVGTIVEYLSSTVVVVSIDTLRAPSANIAVVNTGTLNTGDATSDTVIGDIRTKLNSVNAILQAQGLQKPA